jgi:hypothetical protein
MLRYIYEVVQYYIAVFVGSAIQHNNTLTRFLAESECIECGFHRVVERLG